MSKNVLRKSKRKEDVDYDDATETGFIDRDYADEDEVRALSFQYNLQRQREEE